jgi:hypothetical protein
LKTLKIEHKGWSFLERLNALAKQVLSQLSYTPTVGDPKQHPVAEYRCRKASKRLVTI